MIMAAVEGSLVKSLIIVLIIIIVIIIIIMVNKNYIWFLKPGNWLLLAPEILENLSIGADRSGNEPPNNNNNNNNNSIWVSKLVILRRFFFSSPLCRI
jgi:hypothetical protein